MAAGTFTLADRLGAKSLPCRVPGCTRTFLQLSSKALGLGRGVGEAGSASDGMCEPCREKSRRVHDVERKCDRPGCTGTWTWTAAAQLEAFAADRPAPKQLCADCQSPARQPGGQADPVRGARLHAHRAPRQAAAALAQGQPEAPPEPPRPGAVTLTGTLCAPCADVARRIKDREVNCGINGCAAQVDLEGRRPDRRLRRRQAQRAAAPDVRRLPGLLRQAGRPRGPLPDLGLQEHLDLVALRPARRLRGRQAAAQGALAHVPALLRSVEHPQGRRAAVPSLRLQGHLDRQARRPARARRARQDRRSLSASCARTARRTWATWKIARSRAGPSNCPGTFTWSREQQLAAGVRPKLKEPGRGRRWSVAQPVAGRAGRSRDRRDRRGGAPGIRRSRRRRARSPETAVPAAAAEPGKSKKNKRKRRREIQPPERRCAACAEFLANRKTQEIPCRQCGTPIFWPPESQLQTHLGNWAAPSLCGACKLVQVQAAREAAREILRHSHPQPGASTAGGRRRCARRRPGGGGASGVS